ncbi:MAG: 30S ribosomal protein S6 [Deltaproteobacteria bacterium]|nr:30S ribosomal protein S6 [Deltaproteobacteria bacterium]
MAFYETLYIVHPDHGGRVKEYIDLNKRLIEGLGGTVEHGEEWGLRDLAYVIEKQSKGFYCLLRYRSTARAIEELERTMKLSDGVLRYLTVRLDESAEPVPRPVPREAAPQPKASSEEDPAIVGTRS